MDQSSTPNYINEMWDTQGAGLDVDVRHLIMVSDVMTTGGEVRAIGRHGVSGTSLHSLSFRSNSYSSAESRCDEERICFLGLLRILLSVSLCH